MFRKKIQGPRMLGKKILGSKYFRGNSWGKNSGTKILGEKNSGAKILEIKKFWPRKKHFGAKNLQKKKKNSVVKLLEKKIQGPTFLIEKNSGRKFSRKKFCLQNIRKKKIWSRKWLKKNSGAEKERLETEIQDPKFMRKKFRDQNFWGSKNFWAKILEKKNSASKKFVKKILEHGKNTYIYEDVNLRYIFGIYIYVNLRIFCILSFFGNFGIFKWKLSDRHRKCRSQSNRNEKVKFSKNSINKF